MQLFYAINKIIRVLCEDSENFNKVLEICKKHEGLLAFNNKITNLGFRF